MKQKISPTPWKIDREGVIHDAMHNHVACRMKNADTLLISKAPELLAALRSQTREYLKFMKDCAISYKDLLDDAKAAFKRTDHLLDSLKDIELEGEKKVHECYCGHLKMSHHALDVGSITRQCDKCDCKDYRERLSEQPAPQEEQWKLMFTNLSTLPAGWEPFAVDKRGFWLRKRVK